jgi:predicted nucleic acid-binding protein
MRRLFADAFYWIALLHEGDQWHRRVLAFTETLTAHHLYTTEAVFGEYLATYSARGAYLRQQVLTAVTK